LVGKPQVEKAKPQTRFRRRFAKNCKWLSFIGWCLTKPVRSSYGLTDASHLVYPYPLPQCLGGLGQSPVVIRFNRDFGGVGLMRYENPIHNRPKTTTKTNLSGLKHNFKKDAITYYKLRVNPY